MNYKENIRLLKMTKQTIKVAPIRTGLCSTLACMHLSCIDNREYLILNYLIKRNKPLKTYNSDFYFEPYETNSRLKYLNDLILLNSPNFFIRLYYKFKFRKLYTYK